MAIEVKNLCFAYPGSPVTAVENVSFTIGKGERVAIIGQNGAGKSTTVKIIDNIYKPTSGTILVDGIDTKDKTPPKLHRMSAMYSRTPTTRFSTMMSPRKLSMFCGIGSCPRRKLFAVGTKCWTSPEFGILSIPIPLTFPFPFENF